MLDQTAAAGLIALIIAVVGATKFLIRVKDAETENDLIRLYACVAGALAFGAYAATHAAAGASTATLANNAVDAAGQGFIAGGAAALAVKLYHVAQEAGSGPTFSSLSSVSDFIPSVRDGGTTIASGELPVPTEPPPVA